MLPVSITTSIHGQNCLQVWATRGPQEVDHHLCDLGHPQGGFVDTPLTHSPGVVVQGIAVGAAVVLHLLGQEL
jgi:hypothetical protein